MANRQRAPNRLRTRKDEGISPTACLANVLRHFEWTERARRQEPRRFRYVKRRPGQKMTAITLNCRIAKMLTLFVVIIPRFSLGDANPVHVSNPTDTSVRELVDELDPDDRGDCLSLGALDIVFRTDNYGPPNVGVILTDPHGRHIGFDPLTKHAWQALPVAQGYIDCDDLDGRGTCRGVVQVCGPLSGTYKLEIIAQQTTAYSVSISGRSKAVLGNDGLQCSHSEADLHDVAIPERSRNIILLNYSRDPQENVGAQLQRTPQAQSLDTRSHRHADVKAAGHSGTGQ